MAAAAASAAATFSTTEPEDRRSSEIYVDQDVTQYIQKQGIREFKRYLAGKDDDVYGVLLRPSWGLDATPGVIHREGGGYSFESMNGKFSFIPGEAGSDGSLVVSPQVVSALYRYITNRWFQRVTLELPTENGLLGEPTNRVVIVLPVLPEMIRRCRLLVNSVIQSVAGRIGASVFMIEIEPGEIFRGDTRISSALGIGIDLAKKELQKAGEQPGKFQSIVIPTLRAVEGRYRAEELGEMLYNTVIHRARTSAWTSIVPNDTASDTVTVAGYESRPRKGELLAVSEPLDANSVRCLVARVKIVGGSEYPSGENVLYPPSKSGIARFAQESLNAFRDRIAKETSTSKKIVAKILSKIPYEVSCYSSYYRVAMLSALYKTLRRASMLRSRGKKTEDIEYAVSLFREITGYGSDSVKKVCGGVIMEEDIPAVVTSSKLVPVSPGGFASGVGYVQNAGYRVTTDGRDMFVVIAEDTGLGISLVLPDSPFALAHEYKIVPTSYLYRYETDTKRSVMLPGKGADEYLCMWEPNVRKKTVAKEPPPVILERCFFLDSGRYPVWRSYDSKWSLVYRRAAGYTGWVLVEEGGREIRKDGPSLRRIYSGSWCGQYGTYVVSPKIANPLVAGGIDIPGSVAGESMMEVYRRAFTEGNEGRLTPQSAEKLLYPLLHTGSIRTMPITKTRTFRSVIDEIKKNGRLRGDSANNIVTKTATSENTLGYMSKFIPANVPLIEALYSQRMMIFAAYPKSQITAHREIQSNTGEHDSLINLLRKYYKVRGISCICVPSICYEVSMSVFGARRAVPEVRIATTAPIVAYPTTTLQKRRADGYLRNPTNPEFGKMNQFVTFAANEKQILDMVVMPWYNGGLPRWKPVIPRVPGKPEISAIVSMIKERTDLPMYREIRAMDVIRGIQYGFHRLRTSLFVSIRNGAMIVFAPFVKAEYVNYLPQVDEFWFGSVSQKEYLTSKNRFLRAIGKSVERYEPRARWFVNNSLIGNMISPSLTSDQTTPVVLEMLRETVANRVLNDCDFLVNTRDFPKLRRDGLDPDHAAHGLPVNRSVDMPGFEGEKRLPVFGFNVHPLYADIPIPVPDDWKNACGGYYGKDARGSERPNIPHPDDITDEQWSARQTKAVFRGGATGIASIAPMNQRVLLSEMAEELRLAESGRRGVPADDVELDDLDVELVSAAIRDKKVSRDGMVYMVPAGSPAGYVNTGAVIRSNKKMPLRTALVPEKGGKSFRAPDAYTAQDRYQMVIYVDGNAAAYRYSSLMSGGFVILKVASRVGYEMWMYPALRNALPGSDEPGHRIEDAAFDSKGDHIAVDADMRNLLDVIRWVRRNPDKARVIAQNSIQLYKRLIRKEVLMDVVAYGINLVSGGQTWDRHIPEDRLNLRLVEEPREARAYRNALRLSVKKQEERERVAEVLRTAAVEDGGTGLVQRERVLPHDVPEEGYERSESPGVLLVDTTTTEGDSTRVEEEEAGIDELPGLPEAPAELVQDISTDVLKKYSHGAFRRQVQQFWRGEEDGGDTDVEEDEENTS